MLWCIANQTLGQFDIAFMFDYIVEDFVGYMIFNLLIPCAYLCPIFSLFKDYGNVVEVALIKDKITGQQQDTLEL